MATINGVFSRSVLIIGFAESVSNIGSWITMMAVFALVVFRGDGGVLQSSGIMMAGLLPVFLASPIAGWLCDHLDRRRLMIASELMSALIVLILVFTTNLALIYAALALQAFFGSVMTPARRSLVPLIVDRDKLARANAFFQQLAGTIKIAAPLCAGGLLAIMNPHAAILLDVASFVLSAALLSRLPAGIGQTRRQAAHVGVTGGDNVAASRSEDTESGSVSRRKRAAISRSGESVRATILSSAPLRAIFVAAFLAVIVLIGFDVLVSVYVRDTLQAGEGLFGVLVSLIGVGTVGISLYIMGSKKTRSAWSDLVRGLLLLAFIPFSFAMAAFLPVGNLRTAAAAVGCLAGGIGNGLVNVQAGTLIQMLSPSNMLGRMSGAFQGTSVAGQLAGVVLTPTLVPGFLPIGSYFIVMFSALTLLAVWVILNLRSVRTSGAMASGE